MVPKVESKHVVLLMHDRERTVLTPLSKFRQLFLEILIVNSHSEVKTHSNTKEERPLFLWQHQGMSFRLAFILTAFHINDLH